ncbi:MAG: hypothetical protein BJBARM5_0357 [Candidatus Parvarchaeum acidophilus ARMAN-5]|jgi:hypothetical protein|uniref:Uncharacterized protein n=1 Tax=Candidatus Parvarchaeum acidophilus ARMAN-5 TaxID=662762 RepID=D6GV53_PARA5|nr:MAG: hypothetical protein BJBARM5_0357 [Candidatus Parvarchaeum acidophilus ARMAN-5]
MVIKENNGIKEPAGWSTSTKTSLEEIILEVTKGVWDDEKLNIISSALEQISHLQGDSAARAAAAAIGKYKEEVGTKLAAYMARGLCSISGLTEYYDKESTKNAAKIMSLDYVMDRVREYKEENIVNCRSIFKRHKADEYEQDKGKSIIFLLTEIAGYTGSKEAVMEADTTIKMYGLEVADELRNIAYRTRDALATKVAAITIRTQGEKYGKRVASNTAYGLELITKYSKNPDDIIDAALKTNWNKRMIKISGGPILKT